MNYEIVFARSARRELQRLSQGIAEKLLIRIERLAEQPRPRGCLKLKGGRDLWRIRSGDYRVIYGIDDDIRLVDIAAVRHRSDAYR